MILHLKISIPLEKMSFESFGKQLNIPENIIPQFKTRALERIARSDSISPIFKGIDKVLLSLSSENRLGIITGNSYPMVKRFLQQHRLLYLIELILDVFHKGSKPEKISEAIKYFNGTKENTYMIGDAASDVESARTAGVKV